MAREDVHRTSCTWCDARNVQMRRLPMPCVCDARPKRMARWPSRELEASWAASAPGRTRPGASWMCTESAENKCVAFTQDLARNGTNHLRKASREQRAGWSWSENARGTNVPRPRIVSSDAHPSCRGEQKACHSKMLDRPFPGVEVSARRRKRGRTFRFCG